MVGMVKGTIETNWKHQEGNNIVNAIIGNSSGVSITSIVSASVSASEDSMIITVEIGVETSAGVSMSRRHARKVGNIYEKIREGEVRTFWGIVVLLFIVIIKMSLFENSPDVYQQKIIF